MEHNNGIYIKNYVNLLHIPSISCISMHISTNSFNILAITCLLNARHISEFLYI